MFPEIPSAVRKSLRILATHRALFGGKEQTMAEQDIGRVIQIFEDVGARWALIGAHVVGLLTEPRATADFDFVIEQAKLQSVLTELEKAFGDLDSEDMGAAIRLRAIDVDLVRSTDHPLFRIALERTRRVGDWSVPQTEVVLALKFLAAVNPWRGADRRAQDIVDVRTVYRKIGRERLDMPLMNELAALVYPGAEAEFEALLGRIDRGEPVAI